MALTAARVKQLLSAAHRANPKAAATMTPTQARLALDKVLLPAPGLIASGPEEFDYDNPVGDDRGKVSQVSVHYREATVGSGQDCGNCSMYGETQGVGHCTLVADPIVSSGVCNRWEAAS